MYTSLVYEISRSVSNYNIKAQYLIKCQPDVRRSVSAHLLESGPVLLAGEAVTSEPVAGGQGPLALLEAARHEVGAIVLSDHLPRGQGSRRPQHNASTFEVPRHIHSLYEFEIVYSVTICDDFH